MSRRVSKSRNLMTASNQWAQRPADERFWTLEEARAACFDYAEKSTEKKIRLDPDFVAAKDGNVVLSYGKETAQLTNWSFGQLCRLSAAPADYLRSLPAPLAADCLKTGLSRLVPDQVQVDSENDEEPKKMKALVYGENGNTVLRSINSNVYGRVWNYEVFDRLIPLQEKGWKVPPGARANVNDPRARKATKADCVECSLVKPGDLIGPSGIYASDHDMFAFLVNPEKRLKDGSDGGLSRGFFCSNSEVGAGALRVTFFLFRHVCQNHIVWGAENVLEVSVRHIGDKVTIKFDDQAIEQIEAFTNASAKEDERRIASAKKLILGEDKDEVVEKAYKGTRRVSGINLRYIRDGFDAAVANEETDGNPHSLWGLVNGLTRVSQAIPYADTRNVIDSYASSLLKMVD